MATATTDQVPIQDAGSEKKPRRSQKTSRRKTSHLKIVPETKEMRGRIRSKCLEVARHLDKSSPLVKDQMEVLVRKLLAEIGLPEGYVGWTMVSLTSAFWQDQVASTPPSRRLLLLPHCLKHAEGCPADYDEFGLDCRKCGACSIADFREMAEQMGYKVLVAEGSPIVLKIIISGYVDAIVGVACLNVLEKAIDKILLAGIPCMAVPLLSSDCRNTSVDDDWVEEMIQIRQTEPVQQSRTYVHLMRAASSLFDPDELDRLAPKTRSGPRLADTNGDGAGHLDPIAATEAIALDFLSKGGKRSRPFITLAVHDALTEANGTSPEGADHLATLSDAIKRTAMSIEVFHKASLVHDDIEDNDEYRYGDQTLHRKFGTPTAINVGDYLIGMGYQLVSREAGELGADAASDILGRLAEAHTRLSEGQGAELFWRDARDKRLDPLDALKIYALKTAPAFEAALFAGARLAGPVDVQQREAISQFARHLGIAFQILNDLNDWEANQDNKRVAGGDVLGGRPTVLWALALANLDQPSRTELEALLCDNPRSEDVDILRVRQLYESAGAFDQAWRLVDKYQQRAELVADEAQPDEYRRLLYYLIDTVLERPADNSPDVITPALRPESV